MCVLTLLAAAACGVPLSCDEAWGAWTDGGLNLVNHTLPFPPHRVADGFVTCGELYRLYASFEHNFTDAEIREVLAKDTTCSSCGPGSCFPLCAPAPLSTPAPTVAATPGPTIPPSSQQRFLFIGNSYTANLPQIYQQVVQATIPGRTVTFKVRNPGGWNLGGHTTDPTSMAMIKAGDYDYLVLQDQSQSCTNYFEEIAEAAHELGVTVVIYQTWGRRDYFMELYEFKSTCGDYHLHRFTDGCTKGTVARVGDTFNAIRNDGLAVSSNPGTDDTLFRRLYSGDGSHPSAHGLFAAAVNILLATNKDFPTDGVVKGAPGSVPQADADVIVGHARSLRQVYDSEVTWLDGEWASQSNDYVTISQLNKTMDFTGGRPDTTFDVEGGVVTLADGTQVYADTLNPNYGMFVGDVWFQRVGQISGFLAGVPRFLRVDVRAEDKAKCPTGSVTCESAWHRLVLEKGVGAGGQVTCSAIYLRHKDNKTDAEIRGLFRTLNATPSVCSSCADSCYPLCIDVDPTPMPESTTAPVATDAPLVTDVPVVTSTPVVTDTPATTSAPIVTDAPLVTDTPAVTDVPVNALTDAPAVTDVTSAPVVTDTPAVTSAPTATDAPLVTGTPAVTDTPLVTDAPVVTSAPVVTDTPAVTDAPPAVTNVPVTNAPTDAPAVTDVPVVTNAPVVTVSPGVTTAPVATDTPAVTNAPLITNAPAVTAAPVVTDAPLVTNVPVATDVPTVTDAPIVTDAPVVTDAPLVTYVPMVTDIPVVTVAPTPAVTDAPLVTNTPSLTDAPTSKSAPAVVPVATNVPVVTDVPAVTDSPAMTATPEVTDAPIVTDTPSMTGTPAAKDSTETPASNVPTTGSPMPTKAPTTPEAPAAGSPDVTVATEEPLPELGVPSDVGGGSGSNRWVLTAAVAALAVAAVAAVAGVGVVCFLQGKGNPPAEQATEMLDVNC